MLDFNINLKNKIKVFVNISSLLLGWLIFLLPFIYFYIIVVVGHGGGNGLDFIVLFLYSVLISVLLFIFRKNNKTTKVKFLFKVIISIAFIPALYILIGLFYYWSTISILRFYDIIVMFLCILLFISIVSTLVLIYWRPSKFFL